MADGGSIYHQRGKQTKQERNAEKQNSRRDTIRTMKIAYLFIGALAALWLFSIITTEPPYNLDQTPPTTWWLTTEKVRDQYK